MVGGRQLEIPGMGWSRGLEKYRCYLRSKQGKGWRWP